METLSTRPSRARIHLAKILLSSINQLSNLTRYSTMNQNQKNTRSHLSILGYFFALMCFFSQMYAKDHDGYHGVERAQNAQSKLPDRIEQSRNMMNDTKYEAERALLMLIEEDAEAIPDQRILKRIPKHGADQEAGIKVSRSMKRQEMHAEVSSDHELFVIDPLHSSVMFSINYGVADVTGFFKDFEGSVDFDPKDIQNSRVKVSIDVNSIDTNVDQRDEHLQSGDFFNAGAFPTITFKSTAFELIEGSKDEIKPQNIYEMPGELNMKGKKFMIEMRVKGMRFDTDKSGKRILGCKAHAILNRKDLGIGFGPMDSMVEVSINLRAVQSDAHSKNN